MRAAAQAPGTASPSPRERLTSRAGRRVRFGQRQRRLRRARRRPTRRASPHGDTPRTPEGVRGADPARRRSSSSTDRSRLLLGVHGMSSSVERFGVRFLALATHVHHVREVERARVLDAHSRSILDLAIARAPVAPDAPRHRCRSPRLVRVRCARHRALVLVHQLANLRQASSAVHSSNQVAADRAGRARPGCPTRRSRQSSRIVADRGPAWLARPVTSGHRSCRGALRNVRARGDGRYAAALEPRAATSPGCCGRESSETATAARPARLSTQKARRRARRRAPARHRCDRARRRRDGGPADTPT